MHFKLCAVFSSLVVSGAAHAQNLSDIERITTTASRLEALSEPMPVVISSVDQSSLELLGVTHIEQAMKQVAGANLQHGNGQEYLPALRSAVLTGAGACGGLLTAEDGIALRAAGFCNINELFEAHTEMAQRVEVLKGPGSPLYGSNAIHGVVNVITPDTTYDHGQMGVDWGSYGYTRAKVRAGQSFGEQGIGINASFTEDGGYRDDEGISQQKLNLRHRYDGERVSVVTGVTYTNLDQDTASYIEGFESYKDEDVAQANLDPDAYRKAQSLRAWTQVQFNTSDRDMVSITPYVRDQEMTFFKHFLPGTPIEENAQRGLGVQSLWQHQFAAGSRLNLGVDLEYTDAELLQYQDSPTTGSAFLVATIPEGKHYDYQVDATQIAPFFNIEWQIGSWLLTAGGRFERMEYDYNNRMLSGRTKEDGSECGFGGCRYARPESGTNTYENFSPKLGLSYQFAANHYFYANLSRGYRAPQAAELYQLQREQTNADLDAVIAENAEFGFKGATEELHYVLSAYAMNKSNSIFRDSDFFYISDGESQHRGLELELDYALTQNLMLKLALSHAKHTYSYDQVLNGININGNMMDTAPRNIANAQLNWRTTDKLTIGLETHSTSSYFTDPENLHQYEGHTLVNLRSSYAYSEQLSFYARITNLTDTAYAERADYTSFSGDRYFPGRPRSVMLSAQFAW